MTPLKGIVQRGQILLAVPADLPDGTEVAILPWHREEPSEEDKPLDEEEIARLLALMEQMQPFEQTDEERAAEDARRESRKAWEKAHFEAHADKLGSMWQ